LVDHGLGVLGAQGFEPVIAIDGFLHGGGLAAGDVARDVGAVFPSLQLVVGPLGALAHDRECAAFHALDLRDLSQQSSGVGGVHGRNI
jgi:hypothetical protein